MKVAKLDNASRFMHLEGQLLTSADNIDNLHSNGATYNDDGVYIVNKDPGNTYNSAIDVQGTFPKISGIQKYTTADGSTNGSATVFLLEQYSNKVYSPGENGSETYWGSVDADTVNANTTVQLYKTQNLNDKIQKDETEISTSTEDYFYPIWLQVEVYQILTDITNSPEEDTASKTDLDGKLRHNKKTFIRKGTFIYKIATETEEENTKHTYSYDAEQGKMIGIGGAVAISGKNNTIFERSTQTWGAWEDVSEQYTGYLGALNGTGFNHVNTKFEDNEVDSGQDDYLTLVDAINQLDRVIGSTNQRFTIGNAEVDPAIPPATTQGNSPDDGLITSEDDENIAIKADKYGAAFPDDTRQIQLRADNLANAIIRLALNIGQFEDINSQYNNESLNNMTFSSDYNNKTVTKTTSDDSKPNINSLTDAIKIIDQMVGDYTKIDNNLGNRPVHGENGYIGDGTGQPISETLQHILADLGIIENFTGQNNFNYSADEGETDVTTDKDGSIYSVVSAIKQLNNMIGDYSDIDKDLNNRPVHGTKEDEDGIKTGQPISETIQHILADIGEIETLNGDNYKFDKNSESDLDTDEQAKVFSIVSALKALDKIIGDYKTIENSPYGNRPIHLDFNSITENLKHLSADTGEIESIQPIGEDEKGIYNLQYNTGSGSAGGLIPDDTNTWKASIYSLTDAIKALDAVIGPFKYRSTTNDLFNEAKNNTSIITTPSLMGAINFINNKLIGDLSTNNGKTSTNKIDYKTIQNALNQLDKYLGAINNLDSQNGTDVNENLVDAINILNKLIGDCSEIVNKQDETTINENMPIVKHIKEIYNYYEILRQMINNLGENLDILDLNVTNLMNSGGSNVNLEWGTF